MLKLLDLRRTNLDRVVIWAFRAVERPAVAQVRVDSRRGAGSCSGKLTGLGHRVTHPIGAF